MKKMARREFIKNAGLATGVTLAAPAFIQSMIQDSPNERINVAVAGFHGRGESHYRAFSRMRNVRVSILCDPDERLFKDAVADVEKTAGYRPATEFDFRRLLDDKNIDAISIASPDYWHALMTIWACQAGKDVYVEKPVSFTVDEGRKMVEAARRYKRMVQAGQNRRSEPRTRAAVRLLHDGKLGSVYRTKASLVKPRAGIGRVPDSPAPEGVHWDLFLGPSPNRPFNLNRFHYGWHFFWETSTGDIGNSMVHEIDLLRWGMNKNVHPVRIHSTGGYFIWDSEQETPNVQSATFEYADGTLLEAEVTNLYAPARQGGILFYTTRGYLTSEEGWKTFVGTITPRENDIASSGISERVTNASFPKASYVPGPAVEAPTDGAPSHFENFVSCVRSRKVEELFCDIEQGHLSAALCHLANISCRTGRKIVFDPKMERIVGDDEANRLLSRKYRKPYILPDRA